MADHEGRLIRCFSAVFPDLAAELIPEARVGQVPEWDSLKSMTLVAVVEEEFGLTVDIFDLPELISFEDWQKYIEMHST